jgi:hypothetical protein
MKKSVVRGRLNDLATPVYLMMPGMGPRIKEIGKAQQVALDLPEAAYSVRIGSNRLLMIFPTDELFSWVARDYDAKSGALVHLGDFPITAADSRIPEWVLRCTVTTMRLQKTTFEQTIPVDGRDQESYGMIVAQLPALESRLAQIDRLLHLRD